MSYNIVSSIPFIFFFIVLVITCSTVIETVDGQLPSHDGFISIDCGISSDSTYTDSITNIPYVSDDQFINTGVKANISSDYITSALERQLFTLRSFPDGSRNCYSLNVTQGQKYLVRAIFMYGNYDGRDRASIGDPYLFDLYLDYNLWRIVNIVHANMVRRPEAIFVASADSVSVCLIKTGTGIPFISALELRPLEMDLYPYANATHSVARTYRHSLMPTTNWNIRFPDDIYDRIWIPLFSTPWTNISTDMTVRPKSGNHFRPPSAVMQTAAIPTNSSELIFQFNYEDTNAIANQFYVVFHMSELLPNTNRAFNIELNGFIGYQNYSPPYLVADCVYDDLPVNDSNYDYRWSFDSSGLSQLPPILNALEVYTPIYQTNIPTDSGEVDAITAIMGQYQLKKNWMGDPCAPKGYAWDGLSCSYSYNSTNIETINLSSNALTGAISDRFGMFTHMKYLDLSYNNLTGKIPDALGTMLSLRVVNLTGNNLNGSVPDSLLQKSRNKSLILILDGNPNLSCTNGTSCEPTTDIGKAKKIPTRVIVIICVVPVAVFLLVSIFIWRRKEKTAEGHPLKPKTRPFTYLELKRITNNFENLIGKGGFGNVYRGYLNDGTPVAVKSRSQSSEQGTKQFFAEVQHLIRIHHKYLVSIHGYCMEGNYMALVYEYMGNGNLRDHIIGKTVSGITSDWKKRLQVVIEAAQGLEYLHHGCTPPLVHRDVKSENILLNGRLEAKIADFGLSKAIQNETSNVGTNDSLLSGGIEYGVTNTMASDVTGTMGYLDPHYYSTFEYSEKSDVFSFGVVLLELITGQPPILKAVPDGMVFIVNRMQEMLKKGNIEAIIDSRLQNIYDINSIWRSADLALQCTSDVPSERPTMTEVITQLNESLNLQSSHERAINFERNDGLQTGTSEMGQSLALKIEEFSSPSAR